MFPGDIVPEVDPNNFIDGFEAAMLASTEHGTVPDSAMPSVAISGLKNEDEITTIRFTDNPMNLAMFGLLGHYGDRKAEGQAAMARLMAYGSVMSDARAEKWSRSMRNGTSRVHHAMVRAAAEAKLSSKVMKFDSDDFFQRVQRIAEEYPDPDFDEGL